MLVFCALKHSVYLSATLLLENLIPYRFSVANLLEYSKLHRRQQQLASVAWIYYVFMCAQLRDHLWVYVVIIEWQLLVKNMRIFYVRNAWLYVNNLYTCIRCTNLINNSNTNYNMHKICLKSRGTKITI